MKWIFILLLLSNVSYLGWEIDRNARFERASIISAVPIPAGTPSLSLLSEMDVFPRKRKLMKLDEQISVDAFNSEPVLPIEMNPNTEKMLDELMVDTPSSNLEESFIIDDADVPETIIESPQVAGSEVCYKYGPIPDTNESKLLSNWLSERSIKHIQRWTNERGNQLFWVYLTPRESRAEAEAALKDLEKKGVRDLRLIRQGDLLNAISLGLFSSQASVNRRLKEIATKGYKAVAVPYAGEKKVHWFEVQIVQNSSYVNELFTGFPARFNAVPVDCNQIAMQQDNP